MIELDKIKIDGRLQARVVLDQSVVADYAAAYKSEVKMPPVVLFFDGSTYWLADGFHRYSGAKDAGLKKIQEEVIPGSLRDAILYSLKANETHGLRRSNADKRKAVQTLLADAEWATWSSNAIAKACGVGDHLVADVRKTYLRENEDAPAKRIVERSGKVYEQNTANIGRKTETAAPVPVVQVAQNPSPANAPIYDPADDEAAELAATVRELSEENDALKDRIAAADPSEAGAAATLETICELRKEVKRLEIENRALVASRDSYQRENGELKNQCAMQRKQIAKLQKVAA